MIGRIKLFMVIVSIFSQRGSAQDIDTSIYKELSSITIEALRNRNELKQLKAIQDNFIFRGKKNEVIAISSADINVPEKTGRQIFAKVPGVFVYDLEGGNQLNIATRGLDPHRGWEFNQRKDGVIINSDMYGYPASHYSIPLESVEKIELIRGTGSLQYGAQFGGMLNYISKQGDSTKTIGLESFISGGSYNLLSHYHAIGGKFNKFKYYAYYAKRTREGYRANEFTNYNAQGVRLQIDLIKRLHICVDWARSNYIYKIPGPLTDKMFNEDPTQASRSRNYYNPEINIPSITISLDLAKNTSLKILSSAVLGARNSVIYDRPATIKDSINNLTLNYNPRQVDIDLFNSYTHELRLLHTYKLHLLTHNLVAGIQVLNNHMHRRQLGKGTTGNDYNLNLTDSQWGRNMHFKTKNFAAFVENSYQLIQGLYINFGARLESGRSDMDGQIIYYPQNKIPVSIPHTFTLLGGSLSYTLKKKTEIYGGISQAYRPMLFKDLVPASIYEKVDPNIRDASGYNGELGCRGKSGILKWDITAFILQYNNRFGTLALDDSLGNFYTYRTNIGDSRTLGLEMFLEANWLLNSKIQLIIFTSNSLMDARYISGSIKSANTNVSLENKKLESVPNLISRTGISFLIRGLSITSLFSYTSETFADPLNTIEPNVTGSVGLVPSYFTIDLNASIRFSKQFEIRASINNINNCKYFTKRPLFYPGPGIWPSDGRNGNVSLIFRY